MINSFTFISLFILSQLTIFQSRNIDVEQLYTDFLFLNLSNPSFLFFDLLMLKNNKINESIIMIFFRINDKAIF